MGVSGALRRFFCASTAPVNLAIFRIAVFWILGRFVQTAAWYGSLPRDLMFPPPGWRRLGPLLPHGETAAILGVVFTTACFCAMIGLFTRVSTAAAAILGVYVLGLPQFFGKIDHYHHLVWFAILLACAPAGATLSVDALIRRLARQEKPPETVPAFALRASWILIGFIYFFPGVWKLMRVGGDWIFGDSVKLILYEVWSQRGSGFTPLFRLDQYPVLYRGVGLLTIAFEISFLFLILNRRTRWFAVIAGIAFHLGIWAVMGINFWTLLVCYVAFLDVGRASAREEDDGLKPVPRSHWVGATLIAANFLCGVAGLDTWPVAVYPRFDYDVQPVRATLTLELFDAADRRLPFDPSPVEKRLGNARWTHLLGRIADERSAEIRLRRTAALLSVLQANGVAIGRAKTIRIYRDILATPPHLQRFNPIRRQPLGELRTAGRA